ncbi:MAG: SPOR domain-containing protein [Treponema sp.]|jgi:DedD protein|nr:SPOR domain-containing protein [Treponema sp.]
MEKEQKKILLVAVSVGVFLLVTITAAIVILTPRTPVEGSAFSSSRPIRVQPATETVNIQPQPETGKTVVNIEDSGAAIPVDKNDGDSLTINIPKPTTAAVPDSPEIVNPKPAVAAKPAPAAKPAAEKPAQTAAKKPATAVKSSAKTANDYWVQTGAFSAIVRAEDVKEHLASKGLTSIIETRVRASDGIQLYRVRLGPYTSEKEANHWLEIVQSIDGFNDSQVRQTVRQQ